MKGRESIESFTDQNVNVASHETRVDAMNSDKMTDALIKVSPSKAPEFIQSEMFRAVVPHLTSELFPGGAKAGWWVRTLHLDLEATRTRFRAPERPLRCHRIDNKQTLAQRVTR